MRIFIRAPGRALSLPFATFVPAIAFLAFGATLIGQPSRWENTPAYANLLDLLPTQVWGALYLASSFSLFATILRRGNRVLSVAAHTLAIALTGGWLLGFVIRYLTDDGTTIVNVVNWAVYLTLLIRSLRLLDDEARFAV